MLSHERLEGFDAQEGHHEGAAAALLAEVEVPGGFPGLLLEDTLYPSWEEGAGGCMPH